MVKANEQIAMRVSANTIIGNVILSAFKLFAGIFAHSAAMVSDAVESAADIFSTLIVMAGIKLANRDSDDDHPYGHERLECVASIILSITLFTTGMLIGRAGLLKIIAGNYENLAVPGTLALVAAVVSIAVKEAMYWYTRSTAKKIESDALMADAWHHRSDAFSSIASFVGIFGARAGFPILDPAACVVICLFIVKTAVNIFMDATRKMTDKACDNEFLEEARGIILAQESVLGIDQIKTRMFGNKIYVDIEIRADANAPLSVTHNAAERVHDAIEARFPKVKHCMVHVNPDECGI